MVNRVGDQHLQTPNSAPPSIIVAQLLHLLALILAHFHEKRLELLAVGDPVQLSEICEESVPLVREVLFAPQQKNFIASQFSQHFVGPPSVAKVGRCLPQVVSFAYGFDLFCLFAVEFVLDRHAVVDLLELVNASLSSFEANLMFAAVVFSDSDAVAEFYLVVDFLLVDVLKDDFVGGVDNLVRCHGDRLVQQFEGFRLLLPLLLLVTCSRCVHSF